MKLCVQKRDFNGWQGIQIHSVKRKFAYDCQSFGRSPAACDPNINATKPSEPSNLINPAKP